MSRTPAIILIALILLVNIPGTLCLTCIPRPDVIIWYDDVVVEEVLEVAPLMVMVDLDDVGSHDVKMLHSRNVKAIAYISLGTAEEWRSYWRDEWRVNPPTWMDGPLPNWPGEYMVRYWQRGWLEIVAGRIGEAVEKGFDGIILDNVDVYMLLGEPLEKPLQALRWIRERYGGLIYVNIGAALELLYLDVFPELVDGVLREEVWFTYGGVRVDEGETLEALLALTHFKENGGDVIVLDYGGVEEAVMLEGYCAKHGFTCFMGERSLDHIPRYIYDGCISIPYRLLHKLMLLERFFIL